MERITALLQINKLPITESEMARLWKLSIPERVRSKWVPQKPRKKVHNDRNLLFLLPSVGHKDLQLEYHECPILEYVKMRVLEKMGLRIEELHHWRDGEHKPVQAMKAICGILHGIRWSSRYIGFVLNVEPKKVTEWSFDCETYHEKSINQIMIEVSFEVVRYALARRNNDPELKVKLEAYLLIYKAICKVALYQKVNTSRMVDKEMYLQVMFALLRHYGWTVGQISALRASDKRSISKKLSQFDLKLSPQTHEIYEAVIELIEEKRGLVSRKQELVS